MSKIITEAQKEEIGSLAVEHWEALVAYGADMYRSGLVKGAIIGMTGATLGGILYIALREIEKECKRNKKQD